MAADYTIRTAIAIARGPEDVFDFVTTPDNWPKFWPLTIRVLANNHPLDLKQRRLELLAGDGCLAHGGQAGGLVSHLAGS